MNISTHSARVAHTISAFKPGLRYAPLLCVAALLTSCATQPPAPKINRYVSPAGVPTAKLAIRAKMSGVDLYGVYVLANGDTCSGPQIAGAGYQASNAPPSVDLAAGRWTTVEFITFHPSKQYCVVRWSFQPTAGRTYLISGQGVGTACSARVLDATNPDSIAPEATAVRRNAPGNACVPLAVAQAAKRANTADAGASAGRAEASLTPGATADDLTGLMGK